MGNPFTRADLNTAYSALQEATEQHVATEDNLGDIRETFDQLVGKAFREGSFIVNTEVVIADALWANVNAKAGNNAKNLLRDCAHGQVSMAYDEWLDQVVTVGENRRTLIRDLTKTDIDRMLAVRKANRDKAIEAYETATLGASALNAALDADGDIATALSSGALHITFAEERAS